MQLETAWRIWHACNRQHTTCPCARRQQSIADSQRSACQHTNRSIRAGPSFLPTAHTIPIGRTVAGELLDHVALNGPLLEAEALPVMKQVARPTCSIAAALSVEHTCAGLSAELAQACSPP